MTQKEVHMKNKVLISAPLDFLPGLKNRIKNEMDMVYAYGATLKKTKELLARHRFEAWMVDPCPQYIINRDLISLSPALKIIATPSTGSNHIDTKYAYSRGAEVFTLKDTDVVDKIYASSEFTFNLLISTVRNMTQAVESVKKGKWRESEKLWRGRELHGMCLGIIGFGRIGSNLASYANAFGMDILAYDPYKKIKEKQVTQTNTLDAMLSNADIVAVCVHLSEKTYKMISKSVFDKMKDGVYFINTSRGDILDEKALLDALKSGKIKAAGLDVISGEFTEYKKIHPLIKYAREHKNLIITPHIAGLTFESERKAQTAAYEAIKNYLTKTEKTDVVHSRNRIES